MKNRTNAKIQLLSGQHYLHWLFALCFLSGVFAGANAVLPSAYLPEIVKEFAGVTTDTTLGKVGAWISFIFLMGWILGGIVLGFLSDRIGRRAVLSIALGCCGLGSALGALASKWEWLASSRLLVGMGVGAILVVTPVIISETFGPRNRAIALGALSVSFPVGIIASGLVTYAVESWRMALMTGELCLLLAIPVLFLLGESLLWEKAKIRGRDFSGINNWSTLFSGALIYGAMLLGLWAAFSWLPTWVQSLAASGNAPIGQSERGIAVSLLGAGGIVGGIFSGLLLNRWGGKVVQAFCFAICLLLSYLLFQATATYTWHVAAGIALLGVTFGVSQGVLNAYIPELFPAAVRSTATGLCFNLGRVFTAAAVFFVGALVNWFGGYGNAIFTFSLIYIPGLLVLLAAKQSGKPLDENIELPTIA